MYFTSTPEDQYFEKMMKTVPGFDRERVGHRCKKPQLTKEERGQDESGTMQEEKKHDISR